MMLSSRRLFGYLITVLPIFAWQHIPQEVERIGSAEIETSESYSTKGMEWVNQQEYAKAVESFRNAVRLEPSHAGFWSNLGCSLRDSGRLNEAKKTFKEGLALHPGDNLLLGNLHGLGKSDDDLISSRNVRLNADAGLRNLGVFTSGGGRERRGVQEVELDHVPTKDSSSSSSSPPPLSFSSASFAKESPHHKESGKFHLQSSQNHPEIASQSFSGGSDGSYHTSMKSSGNDKIIVNGGISGRTSAGEEQPPFPLPRVKGSPEGSKGHKGISMKSSSSSSGDAFSSSNASIVTCSTTAGMFHVAVMEAWAPIGAGRFLNMVTSGYFTSKVALFRVVKDFVVQFGPSGDPVLNDLWASEKNALVDDPQWLPKPLSALNQRQRMRRGMVCFAGGGANSRHTQMFIANGDIGLGDALWEVPFGMLVGDESFATLLSLYAGYGELAAFGGRAPDQRRMHTEGLPYLETSFPRLDFITECRVAWKGASSDNTNEWKPNSREASKHGSVKFGQETKISRSTKAKEEEPSQTEYDFLDRPPPSVGGIFTRRKQKITTPQNNEVEVEISETTAFSPTQPIQGTSSSSSGTEQKKTDFSKTGQLSRLKLRRNTVPIVAASFSDESLSPQQTTNFTVGDKAAVISLPRYALAATPTYASQMEHDFFWWMQPLRKKIVELQKRANKNTAYSPNALQPGEVHRRVSFLDPEELKTMRQMFLRLKRIGLVGDDHASSAASTRGASSEPEKKAKAASEASVGLDPSKVHRTVTNQATNVAAFPPVWAKSATQHEKDTLVDVLARVTLYANQHITPNSTLKTGPHAHKDSVGMHLGIFALYEYQPDPTGKKSRVWPHSDSNYEGRCLSAGLHLDNWVVGDDDGGGSSSSSDRDSGSPFENTPVKGGELLMLRCAQGLDCAQGVGGKLAAMHDHGVFALADGGDVLAGGGGAAQRGAPTLLPSTAAAPVPYSPGDLSLFLPETPHSVSPLLEGQRSVMFFWFHCEEMSEPPVKYLKVDEAVDRARRPGAPQKMRKRQQRQKQRQQQEAAAKATPAASATESIEEVGHGQDIEPQLPSGSWGTANASKTKGGREVLSVLPAVAAAAAAAAAAGRPLPHYSLQATPSFEQPFEKQFFWWLAPLREKIEAAHRAAQAGDTSRPTPLISPPDRILLNSNEVHVKKAFLDAPELRALRSMLLRLRNLEDDDMVAGGGTKNQLGRKGKTGPGKVQKTVINQASTVAAFPPVWAKDGGSGATEEERELLVGILAKVALYANQHVTPNSTLKTGPHAHKDSVGMHLGIFTMYEYQPDPKGKRSRVVPHSDMDYEGRCLSAGLHLDNWVVGDDDGGSSSSSDRSSDDQQSAVPFVNTPVQGGEFQILECAQGLDCTQAVGDKLASLYEQGVFAFADGDPVQGGGGGPLQGNPTLLPVSKAPYSPGDLSLFLSEAPHTVTPLLSGRRAILFMWFHCEEFDKPPVKYTQVEATSNTWRHEMKNGKERLVKKAP